MILHVAFLISLPWQPPARNIIAGRTTHMGSNERHPSHAALQYLGHEDTVLRVVRTSVSIAWAEIVDVCAIRDRARLERGLYCNVYCCYTRSFMDHTHRHTDIHS